jgi:phage baseplate assembly protein W
MAFNAQQISPLDFNSSVAIGVEIPFNGNAVFKSNFQTKQALRNNLINFFLTNPGDHYLNPTFGGGLRDFLFEHINSDNLDFLKEDISEKLNINFPNVQVTSLNVIGNDDFNSISVEINYQVSNTNISDTINLQF